MNKKNGFTMIELLIVIVIVGIISALAISATTKYISDAKNEKENQNIITAQIAAESYAQANTQYLPKVVGDMKEISFKDLSNSNYLKEDITDKNDESCMNNSYVLIIKVDDNKYVYKPYIACGEEEKKEITSNSSNPGISISINSFDKDGQQTADVSNAYFNIELKGDKNDPNIKIVSYNFVLYSKNIDKGETEFTEVFNSGSIKGNKLETIKLEDVPISQYIDLTGKTEIKVTASLLNENGDMGKDETSIKIEDTSSSITYIDDDPPVCPDNPIDREGEPAPDEWYNKKNISDGQTRTISLKCDDKNGSGCKRLKFSRTWPEGKDNQSTIQNATIALQDNSKNSADTYCEVRVNIDIVSPEIRVLKENNFAKEVVLEKNSNINELNPSKEIKSTDEYYTNLENLDTNNKEYKWLNKTNYPNGMIYSLETSDDIDIKKIVWKVNKPGEGTMSNATTIAYEGLNVDLDNPSTIPANLNYHTEVQDIYDSEGKKTGEKKVHKFNVGFTSEGARYGELTVSDRAGNKSTITFEAYIDLTAPTTPVITMRKWNDNKTTPSSIGSLKNVYTSNTWSNKKIYTEVQNSKDNFEFSHYEYKISGAEGTENNHKGNQKNITKEGTTNIDYRACDIAKNCTEYNDPSGSNSAVVKIDTVAPTLNVTPKKIDNYATASNGSSYYTSANTNVHKGSNPTVSQDSTGHITIKADQYTNLVNGWMNKANYPKGVAYNVSITDNTSELYGFKWETTSNVRTNNTTIPNDSTITKISGKTYGSGVNTFVLVNDGVRYARIYVRDNAGNYTFAHLYANIDHTDPTGECTFTYKYNSNSDNYLTINGDAESGTTKSYRFISNFEKISTKKNYLKCGTKYQPEMKVTDQAGNYITTHCTINGNTSITTNSCCDKNHLIKTKNCTTTWEKCNRNCGGGTKRGTRTCKTKSAYNGTACNDVSETVTSKCNTQSCCLTPKYGGSGTTAIYSGSDWGEGLMGTFKGNYCMYVIAESKNGVKVTTKNSTHCQEIIKSNIYWNKGCSGWVYKGCFQEYKNTHPTCKASL